jgi:solute carrier family 25 protein 38
MRCAPPRLRRRTLTAARTHGGSDARRPNVRLAFQTAGLGKGPYRTLQALLAEGGVANCWRGTGATVMRVGCGAGVHFFVLQLMRSEQRRRDQAGRPRALLADTFVGGASRAVAVALLCPVTTVKTRMEASGAAAAAFAYRSVPHALRTIARTEGVYALWRGLGPALATNAPFSAIHYAVYRQLQAVAEREIGPGAPANFASGAAASVVATLATQPFDVMRTRAMLNLNGPLGATRGMLSGLGPRLAKRSLQTALVWTMYEELWGRLKQGGHV